MELRNLVIWGSLLGLINVGNAGSVVGSNKATATLSSACTISMSDMSFGTYVPSAGDSFATALIRTRCSKNVPYYIENDSQGSYVTTDENNSTKYAFPYTGQRWSRYMLNASNNRLYFNMFLDGGYSMVFGGTNTYGNIPGYAGKVQIYLTGTGTEQVSTIYGAMAGGQYVQPGAYSATFPVKVNF